MRRKAGTRDWLLTFTVSGLGCYVLNGSRIHACYRGSIVLLPPGASHDYSAPKSADGWGFFWAHFTPRAEWLDWLKWASHTDATTLTISDGVEFERLSQAFARLVHDNHNIGVMHDELADNALAEILIVLATHHIQKNTSGRDPRIIYVLSRLANDLEREISVAELAQSVLMSPSRLAHLFTAQTGEPLMRARMKLRMRHAARLLESTPRQVTDIARDVGFTSLFQFSRQFSRWHAMSPTAYRQHLHNR